VRFHDTEYAVYGDGAGAVEEGEEEVGSATNVG
jgi:hypothetical protein